MEEGVCLYLEVYIDVIFIINFVMDILLLMIVKKILKCRSTKLRMIFGGVIGAFGACILAVIPELNGFLQFLLSYCLICTGMVSVSYIQNGWKARLKSIAVLYITTFFLGGVLNSLYYYSKLGVFFHDLMNGRLFGNLNKTYFVIAILFGTIAIIVFIHTYYSFRKGDSRLYATELFYREKKVRVVGLLDTGNGLYDPIYGKPVIIGEYSVISKLLSEQQAKILQTWLDNLDRNGISTSRKGLLGEIMQDNSEERLNIMMIPYHSVGKKNGILPAFTMDKVILWDEEEQICNEKVLTAVCADRLSKQNEYQLILHKDIM